MKEGEGGDCAFLVQSGKVRIYAGGSGKKVELATMGPGQIFGEMALVVDGPRTATVEAIEDCNLIVLTRDKLKQKLEKSDPTVRALMPMLMKRLVEANNVILNKGCSVAEMIEITTSIYQNLGRGLVPSQKKTLENTVLPKLETFLAAARSFDEKYGQDG